MFQRWEIIRGWMPGIVFAGIAVAIEILYFEYMLGRGLADETFSVSLGIASLPLSIALFLSLGNAIVLLVLWMSVFESTAYVMSGPDRSVRTLHYRVRLVHQHRLRGFELERVSPADRGRLLHVGFRCGYDRRFGQVRRFPALSSSRLHGRGWSSDMES